MKGHWIQLSGLIVLLTFASGFDLSHRRIPNWLNLAGTLAGLLLSLRFGIPGIGESSAGLLTGLLLLMPAYYLGAMGAGDVKLMAAVGAFLGPMQAVGAGLLTMVAGGVLSLAAALVSRTLPRVLDNLKLMGMVVALGRASGSSLRDVQTTGRLPYAVAITAGTAVQLWLAARGDWWFA